MSSDSSQPGRRYFWGSSLPQALVAAARHHHLPPEEIAYRQVEKRHGFLKSPRKVILDVDPAAPRRAGGSVGGAAASLASPAPLSPSVPAAPAAPATPATEAALAAVESAPVGVQPASVQEREPAPAIRRRSPQNDSFVPPDEEARLAAAVAAGRLLRVAGLDLIAEVALMPERLEVRLTGADEVRLRQLGSDFLDDMDHLLPRMIKGLSGRLVHCRIDGAGIRSAREDELRGIALAAAGRVLEGGGEADVILDPLPAYERRLVHMALADHPEVSTESLGDGAVKSMRIFRSPS